MGSLLFTGGDQRRLTETLLHCAEATPVLHEIVSAYERGSPLVAVAASASALAERMFHLDTIAADAVDRSGAGLALLERAVEDLVRDYNAKLAPGREPVEALKVRSALLSEY